MSATTSTTLVPALGWMRRYDRRWLTADLLGGLATGAVVIPQAMAYASIADLPVEVGLYTCMVPMVVYALLGGSRTLSFSTTSTVAVLTASTLLASGVAADSDDPARALATLTVLIGVILLIARVLRLGVLIDNISEATLTGVKFGVGLTVAAGQLPKLLGVEGDPTSTAFFGEVAGVIDDLGDVNGPTIALSLVTLAILVGLARLAPRVPAPLVATVLGIVLVAGFSVADRGIAVIAPVPSGLPTPVAPSFGMVDELLAGAFAIAIMCFLETASAGGAVRRRDEPPIDNDQELVANGAAAIVGGLFRAMPPAGGFSQTAINVRSGTRTQVSELVTALLAVACALFLGGVLSDLPQATLGAMVVVAVLGLIRPSELVRYWRLDRLSFWVALATAATGLALGLLEAVLVGVVLTLLMVLYELNTVGITELQPTEAGDDLRVVGSSTAPEPGLLVLRIDGPTYTANVRSVNRAVLEAVEARRPDVVVLDGSAVMTTSLTVVDELAELDRQITEAGSTLWLAALAPRTLAIARELQPWDDWETAGRLHPTALGALRAYRAASADGRSRS